MYNKLKGLMTERQIKQEELAKILGISVSTFNFKINGKSDFFIREGKAIAEYFDCTMEYIFG